MACGIRPEVHANPGGRVEHSSGTILVASDGRPSSDAAVSAASLLAGKIAAKVEVIAGVESPPMLMETTRPAGAVAPPRESEIRSGVAEQLTLCVGRDAHWPVHVSSGSPADVLTRFADQRHARLLALGQGSRDGEHSKSGGELALRLAALNDTPIIVVAPALRALPRRVIVAVDCSERSFVAARKALGLLHDAASISLVHVVPVLGDAEWERQYLDRLETVFAAFVRTLRVSPGTTVESLALRGDPAGEILALARRTGADLITYGTHGTGSGPRMLMGRVATRLTRSADCSILLVPNGGDIVDTDSDPGTDDWCVMKREARQGPAGRANTTL